VPEGSKKILPLAFCAGPNGQHEWRWQLHPSPRPLYGLDRLAERPGVPILVTEGEKVADAAEKIFPDFVAVTSPGGSKSPGKADWSHVQGRKVVIWGDADEPGREYADEVARLCSEAGAASVSLVDVPDGFPRGWDLADDPPEGTDLRAMLDDAEPFKQKTNGPADEAQLSTDGEDIEATIQKLAALSPFEYDRQRKEAAKRLGIREGTLDEQVYPRRSRSEDDKPGAALFSEIEPWPDSVAGDELLDALIEHFRRFAVLPDEAAPILALWVLHAHAHDAASVSPILAVLSPEKRCGKTTVLSLVQALTPRALSTSNITSAALFRAVEGWGPTLLIDEADTFLRNNEELRGVLNSGHNRFTAYVVRTVGDDHTPAHFRTWAPKAIALIGLLPDTLADRAVTVALRRKRPDERVERLRLDRADEFEPLRRQAARWADDNFDALRVADPDVPFDLHDRAADNWRAMLAIADRAGGHWPDTARRVARAAAANSVQEDSARVMLLEDIRDIFERRGIERLPSVEIVGDLVEMEHRPWPEWKDGKPITVRQVAALLKPFGISPASIRLTGEKTARGYYLTAFKESFLSYLPPIDPTQQHNPQETAPNDGF